MKTMMIRSGDGDKRAGQYKDGDVINDEGAPSGVEIVRDMIESYNNSMGAVMMQSPGMMRNIEHMKDDAGDDNGDSGRDDPLPSMNDELEHENRRVGRSKLTPSSSNNIVRNNEEDVSVSVSVSAVGPSVRINRSV